MNESKDKPTVHGGQYNGVNLACKECGNPVRVVISDGMISVACTTCGVGDRYIPFEGDTTLHGTE